MASITEAHHIAIVLRALAGHGVTQPGEHALAESLAYLDERAAKALQVARILPDHVRDATARSLVERLDEGGTNTDGIHECRLCRGQTCPCGSDDECGHYCPNDPAVA